MLQKPAAHHDLPPVERLLQGNKTWPFKSLQICRGVLQDKMKIGLMNSPYREIESEFKFASELGLSFVDLTIEYPVPRRESINPKSIQKLSKKYGLELIGHTNWRLPIAHEIEAVRIAAVGEIIKTTNLFCLFYFPDFIVHVFSIFF